MSIKQANELKRGDVVAVGLSESTVRAVLPSGDVGTTIIVFERASGPFCLPANQLGAYRKVKSKSAK